ncbi:MAG TPA: SH3 domain-containing protein [bacterium]|nr:SH3 domain-containing protein [bacterium]
MTVIVLGLTAAAGALDAPGWADSISTPEPEPMYALVDVDALNVRDAPSVDGNKIGLLHRGDRVEILAWAVDYDSSDDYVWAEVRSGDLRGYVAAEEDNYYWEEDGVRHLVVEHAFGEPELTLAADLDSDGAPEQVRVGPGEIHAEYEQFYYDTDYVYYLPLVLRVEGSFSAEVRLADFFLGTSVEEVPAEEFIAREKESGYLGWDYNWSLYGLEAGDFNGDGAAELQLTLDARSSSPRPVGGPPSTQQRVLGFIRDGDGLRCIYDYTEWAFIPEWEEEPTGRWFYISGGAELTPEVMRYHSVMSYLDEPDHILMAREWLSPLDWVRHPLPPPDYLAGGTWFSTDLEARWIPEAGFYALYCPPGNDYARPLGYFWSPVNLTRLLYEVRCEDGSYGELLEPLTLLCLPEAGSAEAGVLEAGTSVRVLSFSTGKGDWYLVYTGQWDVFYEEAAPLMGWSRTPPKMEE